MATQNDQSHGLRESQIKDTKALNQPPQPFRTSGQEKAQTSLAQHVQEQTGHAIKGADYGGHGHTQGKQGAHSGHAMPPNDQHMQAGANIPQNRQNTASSGGADDEASEPANYGKVDKKSAAEERSEGE